VNRNTCVPFLVFAAPVSTALFAAVLFAAAPSRAAIICGACKGPTLFEEMTEAHAAVVVRLVEKPAQPPEDSKQEPIPCTFEVIEVVKGAAHLARTLDPQKPYRLKILYFGDESVGSRFFSFGYLALADLQWSTAFALGDAALDYMRRLPNLATAGPERSRFYVNHLEHVDPMLAADAFDELEQVKYSDLAAAKEHLPREQLIRWIDDPDVGVSRRRLYLRLLSLCAKNEDLGKFEALILSPDKQVRISLDAAIFGYLVLKGPAGMPLVEQLYLADPHAQYTDTYSAIMALRLIGSDTKAVSRHRLAEAFRYVLARPEIADLVVGDLARLEDWSAMPRIVQLFKTADANSAWVRVSVINYLWICPLPEAKIQLKVLSKLDPEAAKKATLFNQPKTPLPDKA
jgi:hypothetical protein